MYTSITSRTLPHHFISGTDILPNGVVTFIPRHDSVKTKLQLHSQHLPFHIIFITAIFFLFVNQHHNPLLRCVTCSHNPQPLFDLPIHDFTVSPPHIMAPQTYTSVVLAKRPKSTIIPGETFTIKQNPVLKESDLNDGEVLLETLYLSLDPAMRGWLNGIFSFFATKLASAQSYTLLSCHAALFTRLNFL